MAEYKSFHYLMHAVPEQIKPHYIQAPKALPFTELYSPRNGTVLLGKQEKSFWRTRDRIEFAIYENRSQKVVFVTCRNIDSSDTYRTIFLYAETLFFEVEMKASESESREKLVRKRDKVLNTDELLHKAAVDYILARLLITNDPLPWPNLSIPPAESETTQSEPSTPVRKEASEITPVEPVGPLEKMCTFSKISSDKYLYLEINKPPALSLEGIPHIKPEPSVPSAEDKVVAVAPAGTVAALAASGSTTTPAATASADTSNINVTNTTASVAAGSTTSSTPASAPVSAPSSAPTSARRNVPPLKLSGSRKTIRAPGSTSLSVPAATLADATNSTTTPATDATNATGTTAVAEASIAGANASTSAKKVPSVNTTNNTTNSKTASAGLAKSRSTVIVKQNSTNNSKNNNNASTVVKKTAATATVTAPPDVTTTAIDTAISETATLDSVTNNAYPAVTATNAAAAATGTSLLDTVVNPTERQKSVAPSPSSQRTSILGNRNAKKVVPT